MRDFVEDFVIDFHDLVTDSETFFLRQAPRLHEGHIDANPVLRAAANAEAEALVALVPLHGDLPQLARRLVDEVPPEQRLQGSWEDSSAFTLTDNRNLFNKKNPSQQPHGKKSAVFMY